MARLPPTRSISRSWRTRRSFGWRSSRSDRRPRPGSSVPVCAISNLPSFRACAPVNAPRSWPNSSRLEQLGRQRRAVHRHEGAVAARALAVDRARDQLLAGARFPRDEHGRRGVGDLTDDLVHAPHRRGSADQLVEPLAARELVAEVPHLPLEGASLERPIDHAPQILDRERLRQVIVGAELHRLHCGPQGPDGGNEDHLQAGIETLEPLQHLDPFHAREPHVEEAHVDVTAPDGLERGRPVGGLEHDADPIEHHLHGRAHPGLVVDDEYDGARVGPTGHGRGGPAGASGCRARRMRARQAPPAASGWTRPLGALGGNGAVSYGVAGRKARGALRRSQEP